MSLPALLFAIFDWRSLAVLRRNALVYLRNWRTAFIPPIFEPLVFFLALGFGLRGYVGHIDYAGHVIDYPTYVAPGLIAYTAFGTPFFESLYSSYVRMFYQKTWDGILASQVEMPHIVWGEVLWAGCRGAINATVVAGVLGVFELLGLIHVSWWYLPLLPPFALWAGFCFAAFGLIFTALVPSIDHMNYPTYLVGVPLGLVSNTYFPVHSNNPALQTLIELNPVYELAETFRSVLVGGDVLGHILWLLLTTTGALVIFSLIAQRLLRRRVLGE